MIKRIVNSRLPLIVYNPPKVFDMDYFKETYNAGGLPVLDTEFFEYDEIVEIIERLSNESILFGIRLFVKDQKDKTY